MKNSIKKILIAHSSNDNYGASKVLISVIETFIKNGYETHLFLPSTGPINQNKTIKKIKIKVVNMGIFRKKYFHFFGLINRLFFILKSSNYIKNYIKKNNIDFVYVNTSTLISPLIASKITAKNNLIHVHEIPTGSNLYLKFLTFFFNYFSQNIISVSNSVSSFWLKKGVNKNKIRTVYNGFKFDTYNKQKNNQQKIIFTSISRIIPYKGHLLLIEIFEKLIKKNHKIYFQIIGDTLPQYQNYFRDLKLKVKDKGLDSRISFLGYQRDVIPLLNNTDFFIHLPISPDPLPTVIIEAIKTKTPVITNDLGGAIEILNDGKNGLIIKNNSIDQSVDKILDYIKNKQLQKQNIQNAYRYVCKNFSLEEFQKKILNTIE